MRRHSTPLVVLGLCLVGCGANGAAVESDFGPNAVTGSAPIAPYVMESSARCVPGGPSAPAWPESPPYQAIAHGTSFDVSHIVVSELVGAVGELTLRVEENPDAEGDLRFFETDVLVFQYEVVDVISGIGELQVGDRYLATHLKPGDDVPGCGTDTPQPGSAELHFLRTDVVGSAVPEGLVIIKSRVGIDAGTINAWPPLAWTGQAWYEYDGADFDDFVAEIAPVS